MVASGGVALSVDRSDGPDEVVSTRRPVDAFGEAALYDKGGRIVSARAVEDSEIVLVGAEVFRTTVRNHPDVAEARLRLMASVISRSTER